MFKQSPSRSQRSKGIKVKHVLQSCLLLAVCFWLIYQVKHSHDKKKEFDERNSKISLNAQNGNEILKFGRKDLHPRVEETTVENEKHDEEAGEEEENKHEEAEPEEDSKNEEKEDDERGELEEDSKIEEKENDERGGGDDELDQHDEEKSDVEVDQEDDLVDEEEREKAHEKESDEKDTEAKDVQINDESSLDHDHNEGEKNAHEAREEHYKADDASSAVTHEKGHEKESDEKDTNAKDGQIDDGSSLDHDDNEGEKNAHEAREEPYKADDASSAVTHDTQIISTETENGNLENSNENTGMNITEQETKVNNETDVGQNTTLSKLGDGEMAENHILNAAADSSETVSSKSEDSSVLNSTTTESSNQLGERKSMDVTTPMHVDSPTNGMEVTSDSTQAQSTMADDTTSTSGKGSHLQPIYTEQANNTTFDNNRFNFDSTISTNTDNADATGRELSTSPTNNSESDISLKVGSSEASNKTEDNSASSTEENTGGAVQDEKSDTDNGMGGTNESSKTENEDELQHTNNETSKTEDEDAIQHNHNGSSESSIPLEEKEIRMDLDTLPEIRTEGTDNDDVAAE